jgi:hypothetical protein
LLTSILYYITKGPQTAKMALERPFAVIFRLDEKISRNY